jgi:hypothetical protein
MAAWTTGTHNAVNPQLLDISPFIKHLCAMEPRLCVCSLYGDIEDNKGYFVTKSNIFIPYQLPKIEHDIAHLVELRNSKRWTMTDWGMPRFDDDSIKPRPFFAALSREARTRAIQLHLEPKAMGDMRNTTFNQLANPYWMDMTKSLLPFGRFQSIKDVECWMGELRERTYKQWSLDRIESEWTVRLNHIRHWMETT